METQSRPASKSTIHPLTLPNTPHQAKSSRQHRPSGRRFSGMHLRRDKRFPLSLPIPSIQPAFAPVIASPPLQTDELKLWKEAVMLWLSWNSAQEKLNEKICKSGQDQRKLESLMDEMDMFRHQAIELSERLLAE